MCGNFSFGDYFKEGAIELAWDLVTKPVADGGWGLEESKLWPSVYADDAEAVELWKKIAGLPDERIVGSARRRTTGRWACPARAARARRSSTTAARVRPAIRRLPADMPRLEDRYLEIWNLVFMQDELSAVAARRTSTSRAAAEEEHRHRHGARAGRVPAAGRRQHVRDRRDVPGHREGRASSPAAVRRDHDDDVGSGSSPTTCAAR
jgi:hypothetical protein